MRKPKPQQLLKQIVVGKLGAPFGVKGWLKLYSYTNPKKNIFDYLPWQVSRHPQSEVKELEYKKMGNHYIVKIPHYDTPEDSSTLTLSNISVFRSQLPELTDQEYYWSDLEGLSVYNREGVLLGIVQYLMDTGANDIVVVKGEREYLIPFIYDQFIIEVNLLEKKIIVDWDADF